MLKSLDMLHSKSMDTNKWVIMFYNEETAIIDNRGKVTILNSKLLPFDIYLEESDDFDSYLNNIVNFWAWCSSRILSLDRTYSKNILNSACLNQCTTDKERARIALLFRCVSLRDNYWVKELDDNIHWEDINLFDNSLGDIVDIALLGNNLTVTNKNIISKDLFTDGVKPKAWVRDSKSFLLYKEDLEYKEVVASMELLSLGFNVLCYSKSSYKGTNCSVCKCFTSKDINYITAGKYLYKYSINEIIDKYSKEFYEMILCDYLIGNSDRHQDNWGFLFNKDREIVGFAPVFDFDHAFKADIESKCLPMYLIGRSMNQIGSAKEAAEYLKLDLNKLINLSNNQFIKDRLLLLTGG